MIKARYEVAARRTYFPYRTDFWFVQDALHEPAMEPLPGSMKDLIESKTSAIVATLLPDRSPHVVQTWVDHDGDLVIINTNEGSQKHKKRSEGPESSS